MPFTGSKSSGRHRLRGFGTDQLGGEAMTARYSHGGPGWNQQLRHAVTLLETAYSSHKASDGHPADAEPS